MTFLLVAVLLAAAPGVDTVYTVDGGRITGSVLEESPTSGVTIQTPDGAVRRIDRNQVARIEFADGTVSTVRPPTQPAAPLAPAVAPPPAAAGPTDAVFFAAGGRVRGTVIEENPATGVKVRLLDGSIHTYAPDEVGRIEFADGTVSTHRAPAPRPAEAAPRTPPAEPVDTVYFLAGGRVRGMVIEENPRTGVKVRLMDGTIQIYPRDDLVRIEYADGSVSRRKTPPPPPAPAAQPIPQPIPQPAVAAPAPAHLLPLYLTLGVGVTFLGGDAADGVPMSAVMDTTQAHLSSELGLRLTPSWAIGAYGDIGGGEPSAANRDRCRAQGLDCTGTTGRAGVLLRHTWAPFSSRPKWISLGTGWEFGGVFANNGNGNDSTEVLRYTGREYLRLGAGIDFRSNQVFALGVYGSFAFGEYDKYKDVVTTSIQQRTHTTGQVGLRLTLFP